VMLMSKIHRGGFTVIELMVSIGIMAVLFALATVNITRLPSSTAQATNIDTLLTDLRSEQTRAMTGFSADSFGVAFGTTSYTLLSDNFVVDLDPNLEFIDNNYFGGQVTFAAGSGDILNYSQGSDNVSVKNNMTGEVKVIRLDKYGATY
jgi:prepilin-type N-terminal cleavage/methylation domain-containing protein